jgi:pimeloyl-ACP methyl ester carboxylesterase
MQHESRVDRLILLAPAIHRIRKAPYVRRKITVPVHIYHGTQDEVIPLRDVEREAKELFSDLTFNIVDDDHFLHKTFPTIDWDQHLLDL